MAVTYALGRQHSRNRSDSIKLWGRFWEHQVHYSVTETPQPDRDRIANEQANDKKGIAEDTCDSHTVREVDTVVHPTFGRGRTLVRGAIPLTLRSLDDVCRNETNDPPASSTNRCVTPKS